MRTLVLQSLWARKRRVVGAGIAVIIGIAFLTSTLLLGNAMTQGIDNLFTEGYSGTDVEVRSTSVMTSGERELADTVDESLVDQLATIDGVAAAIPVVEGTAQVVGRDGEPIGGNGPPTIGMNWVDYDRNPYEIIDGRAPSGAGEVVLDSGVADDAGLAVGDSTTVRVPEPIDVTVVGIAELGSGDQLGGVTFTWFDTDTAQQVLLGADDQLYAVDLLGADDVDQEALRAAVAAEIPGGTEALTRQELIDEELEALDADFLGFFKTFLLAFAGVALLVATFSIHNTFAIVVAQRTRETALLRAIGASRRQVLGAIAAEALLIGVLASGVGLAAGVGVAYGLNALLTGMGFGVPTAGLGLTFGVAVTGMIIGTLVTLLAAIVPAVRAARVAPIAALRDAAIDDSGSSRLRALLGAIVTTLGVTAIVGATSIGDSPMMLASLGSVLAFVGIVLLGPIVARFAAAVIGAPIAALRGQNGRLARRNAMRNPKRTSGTASALMIGTAVVALFASLGTSIKASIGDLVEESFGGDLVIYPEGFSGAGIAPELAEEVSAVPGVDAVARLSFAAMLIDGRNDEPLATDFAQLDRVADLGDVDGDLASIGDGGFAVGRGYADDHDLSLGDEVTAEFLDGSTETLTVDAIYENANLMGDNLVDHRVWERHANVNEDLIVMVGIDAGADLATVRADVQQVVDGYGSPRLEDSDEYLASQGEQIDQMLGLVYGLLGLAVIIALVGIANTLSLSIHERTREIGLLRAVGQSRRSVRSTVRWESVIIAIFGTVGGLALGTLICWGLVRAISVTEGFGTFAPSMTTMAIVLGVSIVAGVVAAVRPARRAAKLDVLQAIATD
jgi:putative ABC transport system permease protein